jgi:cytochrome c peroxidase
VDGGAHRGRLPACSRAATVVHARRTPRTAASSPDPLHPPAGRHLRRLADGVNASSCARTWSPPARQRPQGKGFSPPSLLGIQTGAPYFHGGNARTLEEVFSAPSTPTDALTNNVNFLDQAGDVDKLVAFCSRRRTTAIPPRWPWRPG